MYVLDSGQVGELCYDFASKVLLPSFITTASLSIIPFFSHFSIPSLLFSVESHSSSAQCAAAACPASTEELFMKIFFALWH